MRVSQGGTKTFILDIDKSRRTIGRFGIITLADARTEVRDNLRSERLGAFDRSRSPSPQRLMRSSQRKRSPAAPTIMGLQRLINLHFRFKGQLADVKHTDIERRLLKIKSKSEHNHALLNAKTFLTWARRSGVTSRTIRLSGSRRISSRIGLAC
jgi:hypothetical protein